MTDQPTPILTVWKFSSVVADEIEFQIMGLDPEYVTCMATKIHDLIAKLEEKP